MRQRWKQGLCRTIDLVTAHWQLHITPAQHLQTHLSFDARLCFRLEPAAGELGQVVGGARLSLLLPPLLKPLPVTPPARAAPLADAVPLCCAGGAAALLGAAAAVGCGGTHAALLKTGGGRKLEADGNETPTSAPDSTGAAADAPTGKSGAACGRADGQPSVVPSAAPVGADAVASGMGKSGAPPVGGGPAALPPATAAAGASEAAAAPAGCLKDGCAAAPPSPGTVGTYSRSAASVSRASDPFETRQPASWMPWTAASRRTGGPWPFVERRAPEGPHLEERHHEQRVGRVARERGGRRGRAGPQLHDHHRGALQAGPQGEGCAPSQRPGVAQQGAVVRGARRRVVGWHCGLSERRWHGSSRGAGRDGTPGDVRGAQLRQGLGLGQVTLDFFLLARNTTSSTGPCAAKVARS